MSLRIEGMGWVTPLGNGLDEVWTRLNAGEIAPAAELSTESSSRKYRYFPVPPNLVAQFGKNPRLRRSSSITYFTAGAGLAAIENAGLKMTPEIAKRTAIIFAIASGGVIYTRKFYDAIARQGANAASPLLFPETVYNAPAAHLAALLGIDGASYTLVGDGSVGLAALKMAEQLLADPELEHCLVVGGEEIDWILCEAYRTWRLIAADGKIELHSGRGTLFGDCGAAILAGRAGPVAVAKIHSGESFFRRQDAPGAISRVLSQLAQGGSAELAVSCANGTFIDDAERAALAEFFPNAKVLSPKRSIGEALGAGALVQTIVAALALQHGDAKRAVVSSLGFNQQAAGAILSKP